jgi:tRNA(adenine34) deaminase
MNKQFMELALDMAKIAYEKGEVPVGAVIVQNGKIIAKAYNKKESKHCSIYHAEILAIKKACNKIKDWRLNDCEMYVSLEPCAMCAGAIMSARLKKVYIGAMEKNFGCCGSAYNLVNDEKLCSKVEVASGIMEKESIELLQKFYQNKRK